jgi:hypothetical protein
VARRTQPLSWSQPLTGYYVARHALPGGHVLEFRVDVLRSGGTANTYLRLGDQSQRWPGAKVREAKAEAQRLVDEYTGGRR